MLNGDEYFIFLSSTMDGFSWENLDRKTTGICPFFHGVFSGRILSHQSIDKGYGGYGWPEWPGLLAE